MTKYPTEYGMKTVPELMEITGLSKGLIYHRMKMKKPLSTAKRFGRASINITHDGITLTAQEWVETVGTLGLNVAVLTERMRKGWPTIRALNEPVRGASNPKKGVKLTKEIVKADEYVSEYIGHNEVAHHAARLLAQGLNINEVKRRVEVLK